jgi:hypothetical protein
MSMSTPMEPELGRSDDGVPAADPGAGAPPSAEGFGVGGEEPDRPEQGPEPGHEGGLHADPPDDPPDSPRDDVPFRTPDPTEVGPGG